MQVEYRHQHLVEVVEPRWQAMTEAMATAATLDDVIVIHDAFLEGCMRDTLLAAAFTQQGAGPDRREGRLDAGP